MYSLNKTIRTISLIGAAVLATFTLSPQARAVCQEGCDALLFSTFLGEDALLRNTGLNNTAIGFQALLSNRSGGDNTATGAFALHSNTSEFNTATGTVALYNNTSGAFNTATGAFALYSNTGGSGIQGFYNTATGTSALYGNTTGGVNTATGNNALSNNTTGSYNTAAGGDALSDNRTGFYNTANGWLALRGNTRGYSNTATGQQALSNNTAGSNNTASGAYSLYNNTTGSFNVALGYNAGKLLTTGNANIVINNPGVAGESNTIRIGKVGNQTATYIAGISGATVPAGVGAIIDTNGHLGTVVSSARYKDAIKPMDKASEAILALKPVTFHYKKELDPDGIPQFGLVAEQVEKVSPDLVARDDQGKPYTVRYEAVNAMLLNEFLKEHRGVQDLRNTVTKQQAMIAQQQREIQTLSASLKAQAAQIQKVSNQLKTQGPAPRVVANN